jgi:hypothetical protein
VLSVILGTGLTRINGIDSPVDLGQEGEACAYLFQPPLDFVFCQQPSGLSPHDVVLRSPFVRMF